MSGLNVWIKGFVEFDRAVLVVVNVDASVGGFELCQSGSFASDWAELDAGGFVVEVSENTKDTEEFEQCWGGRWDDECLGQELGDVWIELI
ncbi:hypothetical protein [Natranaeroarchaeum sulfidigenes]|uniref:hypothetical protein n=1 Tax=Natranaeroarchaeum sulfidigenes TaxID=2784880 RepID=UPI001EE565E4|nr:hypothetical protein [Natranaeroarchaeum sulfidigenes]